METYCIFGQVCLLVGAIVHLYVKKAWYIHTNTWTSIVTIVGVFGTFLGVFIGLQDFQPDPDKIQKSIEELLRGLRLAFSTSIFGILSAIILKGCALWYQTRNPHEDPGLKAIAQTDDILKSIKAALSGPNDETVLTQLQTVKRNIESSNTQLVQKVSAFSGDIAEKCSILLVEALKEVVENFNMEIEKQFGNNFLEFKAAVGDLNKWLDRYRDDLQKAVREVNDSREALASASNSLTTFKEQSDNLFSVAKTLDPLLEKLNRQLETTSELREQASNAFPRIEKGINELTTKTSEAFESHVNQIQTTLDTTAQHLAEVKKRFSETTDDLVKADLQRSTTLSDITQSLQRSAKALEEFLEHIEKRRN